MSFGNHKSEHHDSRGSLPLNDDLDKLNQLGGLNDLMGPKTQGNLDRLAHDGNKLGHDLKHPSLDKAGLDHTLGDVGKFADDLNNSPLGKLDNLAGDLAANDANGQNGDADKDKVKRPENDLDALNDLGNVGSLASRANKGDHGKQKGKDINPADALKDASNLADDLKHNQPHKLGKDVGKLGKDTGLGALSFGPMEDTAFGKGKNPLDHPLDRKVANGSIMPEDLRNQRGNDSYHPRPPKTLLDRLKDGGKYVGRKFKDGLKSAFSHATGGVMSAVHHLTGASIAKATAAKIVATGMLVPALAGGSLIGVAVNQDNNYQVLDAGNICGVANDNGMGEADSDGAVGNTGGSDGDFKTSNTARKHAKSVFMAWVNLGLSGAAASGIVGWTNSEGGYGILDRAEGHYGNDEKTNGIAYGVAPINDHGGGGGIYQFTPYTKFAGLNDKKWLSAREQNKFVMKSLKGGDWISSYDLTGKNHSFKEFAHEKDPGDAALEWQAYERGQVSAGSDVAQRKIADAKWIYKHFNGSKYQANDSLLGKMAGGIADANSSIAETINNLICKGGGSGGPAVAGSWGKPFPGFNRGSISSPFGPRDMGWHDGIDIGTANHTGVIRAIHGGKVTKIGCIGSTQNDLGYFIIVQSPDGYSEIYQEFAFSMADGKKVSKVKVGDTVKTGQPIAELSPSTPNVTHIHIGVFKGSGSQLFSDGIPHSFTPNYPKWKDPAKLILG